MWAFSKSFLYFVHVKIPLKNEKKVDCKQKIFFYDIYEIVMGICLIDMLTVLYMDNNFKVSISIKRSHT